MSIRPTLSIVSAALAMTFFASGLAGCRSTPSAASAAFWIEEQLPPLPNGQPHLGVARPFYGLVPTGELLLAGGSNFPDTPASEGGAKACHADIFLRTPKGTWLLLKEKLPNGPVAEGIPVTTGKGIACIGGTDGKADLSSAFLMGWDAKAGKTTFSPLPNFPKTIRMGAGAVDGSNLYVACGKQNGTVANGFYRLDLEHPEAGWTELPPVPGVPREQPVAGIAQDAQGRPTFYIFGGNGLQADGSQVALTDGYAYTLEPGSWSPAPPVQPANFSEAVSLLGAAAVVRTGSPGGAGRWLLCEGGFNKEVWDEACRQIARRKGDDLAAYRKGYLSQDPANFRWNRRILAFDATTGQWTASRPLPFLPRCGAAFAELPNGELLIASGEIKPGSRTPCCELLSNWPGLPKAGTVHLP